MINVKDLEKEINPLAKYYKDFRVTERILLTGHSHQAQPDCALEGIKECWDDASWYADDKWEKVFEVADKIRNYFAKLIDDSPKNIVLAQNTHDLLLRFLSSLDLKNKNKIITTDGEFHTIRRQLDRLNQGLLNVIIVKKDPIETLTERIINFIDNKTSAVLVSKVMFQDSSIVNNLSDIEDACLNIGAELMIDVYHVLNAIPFSIKKEKLENSFLVGGGYKYLQLGEGNCFMRIPENKKFKPVITGWFAEFANLSEKKNAGEVLYGNNHWAFAGSTYDPVSHYRALKVFEFFEDKKLTPELLRELNLHQKEVLASNFEKKNFNPEIIKHDNNLNLKNTGAFVTFKTPFAKKVTDELRFKNIFVDSRGDYLRLGPAPFLSDNQLIKAIEELGEVIKNF